MENKSELINKAVELRKQQKFEEASDVYKQLWSDAKDKLTGCGLLNCLRKLERYDEAIPLADYLIEKYSNFQWCKREVVWTYIKGIFDRQNNDESIEKVIEIAERILSLEPEVIATKYVVFKVLKNAKDINDWNIINHWILKLNPESLSNESITIDGSGRKGWSEKAQWYNYRIRGIIESGEPERAFDLIETSIELFPKQKKFFKRLKALAYVKLENRTGAEKIYLSLCKTHNPDWWLLHEYAKVVRDLGKKDDALKLMFKAANCQSKLESKVNLFFDIGLLLKELKKYKEARAHLILNKHIRVSNNWSIPADISIIVSNLNKFIGNDNAPSSLRDALIYCRKEWNKLLIQDEDINHQTSKIRKKRNDLTGIIKMGSGDRPFGFINSVNNESFYYRKSDVPEDIEDGSEVKFNAIPSFDRKKNKESWKAVDITVLKT